MRIQITYKTTVIQDTFQNNNIASHILCLLVINKLIKPSNHKTDFTEIIRVF